MSLFLLLVIFFEEIFGDGQGFVGDFFLSGGLLLKSVNGCLFWVVKKVRMKGNFACI